MAEGSNNHYAPSRDLPPDLPVPETNPNSPSQLIVSRSNSNSPVCESDDAIVTGLPVKRPGALVGTENELKVEREPYEAAEESQLLPFKSASFNITAAPKKKVGRSATIPRRETRPSSAQQRLTEKICDSSKERATPNRKTKLDTSGDSLRESTEETSKKKPT